MVVECQFYDNFLFSLGVLFNTSSCFGRQMRSFRQVEFSSPHSPAFNHRVLIVRDTGKLEGLCSQGAFYILLCFIKI